MKAIITSGLFLAMCAGFNALAASQIALAPTAGPPGSTVQVRGEVSPGTPELRFYWEQNGEIHSFASGTADAAGTFALSVQVPQDAAPGRGRIGVLPLGAALTEIAFADFTAERPAAAQISGTVETASGTGVGAGVAVQLLDKNGLPVAETLTDVGSRFAFLGLAPGQYLVQPLEGSYPPTSLVMQAGGQANLIAQPGGILNPPPVYLLSAGAIAIPGGSFSGNQVAQVGDWSDTPLARLVSLKGKGLAPVTVRFWARLQRSWLLPTNAPLLVGFSFKKGSQIVANAIATASPAVFNQSQFNFPAFTADFNSLELPPGKLTLVIGAVTSFFVPVGEWEYPVDVVDLGNRWYAGNVKSPQFTVTRQDFFQLRYDFNGTLPGGIPGIGTPLFSQDFDLKFKTVHNHFDLGIALSESFYTYGGWSAKANALADLTLLDTSILNGDRALTVAGNSLPDATYSLPLWEEDLPDTITIPVWGAALPSPINVCGLKFNGQVGITLDLDGGVTLGAQVHPDLSVGATVTPTVKVSLPVGASVEAAVCKATANIKPSADLSAPIILDPAHSPPVYWEGLCLSLSGKANLALTCCGLGFDKSVNLFDPINIGNCPGALGVTLKDFGLLSFAPPRHASVAYNPSGGMAIAVWEDYLNQNGAIQRTPPVYSVYNGSSWTSPQPIAGPEFAGWEPQVTFLDAQRAIAVWVRQRSPLAGSGGPTPKSLCDTIGSLLDYGCGLVGGVVDVVSSIFSVFDATWQQPVSITADAELDLRPALASDPVSGQTLLVWLREQQPVPGQQQALALYYSRFTGRQWAAPQRVDPASDAFDLQPSIRFDRQGQAAAIWVRDADGDLGTPSDRSLVFSRLGTQAWSAPETIRPLPLAPWTPSLDFDNANHALVAFVVPMTDPNTGVPLSGDGMLSTLQVARQTDRGWTAEAVGEGTRAEHPLLRVTPDNHALLMYRSFGTFRNNRPAGDIATAVTDLASQTSRWTMGRLNADNLLNWEVTGDLNPSNGAPLLVWEAQDRADMLADPVVRQQSRDWAIDLSFDETGISFSPTHPDPRQPVEISVRLTNLGLKPLGPTNSLTVSFYDQPPTGPVTPFATPTASGPLGFGEAVPVRATYTPADRSFRTIYVVADSRNSISESDETNNEVHAVLGGLETPQNLAVTPAPGGLRLRWTYPSTPDSMEFWIWRVPAGGGLAELIGATTNQTFLDSTAVPGQAYTYQLVAFDSQGVRSPAATSMPVAAARPEPVAPESLRLAALTFQGALTLSWPAHPPAHLESAPELAGTATRWTMLSQGVTQIGGLEQLTLPAVQNQQFFRLVSP